MMLSVHRYNWPKLYVDMLRRVTIVGEMAESREGDTLDMGPVLVGCPCPGPLFTLLEGRGGKIAFAETEALTYLAGETPDWLLGVAPRYVRFREADGTWYGAYGPRLRSQLFDVVVELAKRPNSRRAIANIWRPDDIWQVASPMPPRDIPCTLSLQFRIVDHKLDLTAFMRSCDLWFGLYYDLPAFAFLQRAVALALKVPPGMTHIVAGSMHLYRKDLKRSKDVSTVIKETGDLNIELLVAQLEGTPAMRFDMLRDAAAGQLHEMLGKPRENS